MNNVTLALITGLTTGGVSCFAVQGGLLATAVTGEFEKHELKKYTKVAAFIFAKITAYTMLGFGLGWLGQSLTISPKLLGLMQIAAGIFMIGTAARLLNVHPVFRYFALTPPKWAYRILRTESKNATFLTPVLLGGLTILIPCGVTQAMIALAIASANPLSGATIMFAFTLGTSPIFFAMGMAVAALLKKKVFVYASSLVLVVLGMISINSGQVIRGSVHTFGNYLKVIRDEPVVLGAVADVNAQGMQEVTINVTNGGYSTETKVLKAGVPVKLKLVSNNVTSCARSFIIPSEGISKILGQTGETEVEFTPQKTGTLSYSCGMGMYTGAFTVTN